MRKYETITYVKLHFPTFKLLQFLQIFMAINQFL